MKESLERELLRNIFPFWSRLIREDGSFPGKVDVAGVVDLSAPVGAVMAFRVLWSLSAVHRKFPDSGAGDYAARVYDFVVSNFVDRVNGGILWSVGPSGEVVSSKKQSYAIGFAIYALSEYSIASGSSEACGLAMQLFRCLEEKAWDASSGGYVEALSADWTPLEDVRLSDKDMNAVFTMNTHLHILEPYTSLYTLTSDASVRSAILRLLDIFRDRIYDTRTRHLGSFFNSCWERLDTEISYGHDIEASWLICEAADAVGVADRSYHDLADRLVMACEDGFRADGSLVYRYDSGRWDEERHWWVQAEAAVGLMKMYRRTADLIWLDRCHRTWDYIRNNIVDTVGGEWFWSRLPDGSINRTEDKAGFWKCPYHNSRMCVELLNMLENE